MPSFVVNPAVNPVAPMEEETLTVNGSLGGRLLFAVPKSELLPSDATGTGRDSER